MFMKNKAIIKRQLIHIYLLKSSIFSQMFKIFCIIRLSIIEMYSGCMLDMTNIKQVLKKTGR